MEVIVYNIRRILEEKGIKQKKLAQKANITENTLSAMLNGRRTIHHSELINICLALDVTPNDIYGFSKTA